MAWPCTEALTQLGRSCLSSRRKAPLSLEYPQPTKCCESDTTDFSSRADKRSPKDEEATLSVSDSILGPCLFTIRFQGDRITQMLNFASELVTEQDPMGPSQDRPLPHILCCSSSLKDLDNSIGCTFPELFYRC